MSRAIKAAFAEKEGLLFRNEIRNADKEALRMGNHNE